MGTNQSASNLDWADICLQIAKSEDGDDVKKVLEKNNLWDDKRFWRVLGGNKDVNTHSVVGSQQSNPVNALVEKLVNCGDSALVLKCKESGIDPKGNDAPQNVKEAIGSFFEVMEGRWINTGAERRKKIAEEFCNLVATGERGKKANPTYTIIDNCEGQHPHEFDKTFVSLTRKNKTDIKFIQGKFGMGSHGALNFCTKNGLQLIISKKNPKLLNGNDNHLWGFTVVRKEAPEGNEQSSKWRYLVMEDNKVPSFEKNDLKLFPGEYPNPYGGEFKYGSFIKLYNYDIGPGLRTAIILDLHVEASRLLVNPVVPVRFHERREGFKANSYEATLDGLETKLERDRSNVLEQGFPAGFDFNVGGQGFKGNIYAFKKYSHSESKEKVDSKKYGNGVLFTINGQSNGELSRRFFTKGELKYENISKNLLVIIDCSNVEPKFIEQLFQNNREQIYDNNFTKEIKNEIVEVLKNHDGLKSFQNQWKSSEIQEIPNSDKTKALFEKFISNNPNIASFLQEGKMVANPFKKEGKEEIDFKGEAFPTFFKLRKQYPEEKPRQVERGRNAKVAFETDAPNDYLTRGENPGSYKVFCGDKEITNSDRLSLFGFNGNWTLVLPTNNCKTEKYKIEISDVDKPQPLSSEIYMELVDRCEREGGPKKTPPKFNQLALPKMDPLTVKDFEEEEIDEKDMLFIEERQDGKTSFNFNMDNSYVNSYLNRFKGTDIDYAKQQYEVSLAMLGLALLKAYKARENKEKNGEDDETLKEFTKNYTRSLAPIYMYLIKDIANL